MILRSLLTLLLFISLSLPKTVAATPGAKAPEAASRAALGVEAMQQWYVERTGLYETTGWWNAANAVTVLVDFMRATGSRTYLPELAHTFSSAQIVVPKEEQVGSLHEMTGAPGFLNAFYDDEGWWALAWIDAYDLTREPRYLAMGESIFADMAGGWDQTCGGGIWWSKERKYKNAIANELFLSVAAHLASRDANSEARRQYEEWFRREWNWFQGSSMINSDGLVNDGLKIDAATGVCRNNGGIVWTYNQGVLIGGLVEGSQWLHDQALVGVATRVADASLLHLADNKGVLHEPCEPNCGGDGVQFKGIFVRNLRLLYQRTDDTRYAAFFKSNADSVWTNDQAEGHRFGVSWGGPVSAVNAGTQSSALDALVTAAWTGR